MMGWRQMDTLLWSAWRKFWYCARDRAASVLRGRSGSLVGFPSEADQRLLCGLRSARRRAVATIGGECTTCGQSTLSDWRTAAAYATCAPESHSRRSAWSCFDNLRAVEGESCHQLNGMRKSLILIATLKHYDAPCERIATGIQTGFTLRFRSGTPRIRSSDVEGLGCAAAHAAYPCGRVCSWWAHTRLRRQWKRCHCRQAYCRHS